MTIIAQQIAKYRKFIGYSDQQLIKLTKIPKQRFMQIINGNIDPYLKELLSIANVLHVPWECLIDLKRDYSFKCHLC